MKLDAEVWDELRQLLENCREVQVGSVHNTPLSFTLSATAFHVLVWQRLPCRMRLRTERNMCSHHPRSIIEH